MILSPTWQNAGINPTTRGQALQVQWYQIARYAGWRDRPMLVGQSDTLPGAMLRATFCRYVRGDLSR
jgi:hypothetical protein